MSAVIEEADLADLVEEPAISCQECDAPAEWIGKTKCGRSRFWCTVHRDAWVRHVEKIWAHAAGICRFCQAWMFHWTEHFDMEPL